VARVYLAFRTDGALVGLALGMAFLSAYLAQSFGLALIIGAYSAGLAFSRTSLGHTLEQPLRCVYHALVPIFFVLMGMLVNLAAILPVLAFGSVITLLAVVGKIVGCAAPALLVGFNSHGALRVGLGMLPRGEVALIIAGAGLASGAIGSDVFGVSVMMTIVTTVLAPIVLVPSFRHGATGWRAAESKPAQPDTSDGRAHALTLPAGLVPLWLEQAERALGERGFERVAEVNEPGIHTVLQYRAGQHYLSIRAGPEIDARSKIVVEADTRSLDPTVEEAIAAAARATVAEVTAGLAAAEAPGRGAA
jgi:predicted transcriptional regulator